jgi:hypothetical protein
LHVKDDYFFEGTPTHIKYKSESHVEARDETKGSVNIKDMAEQLVKTRDLNVDDLIKHL